MVKKIKNTSTVTRTLEIHYSKLINIIDNYLVSRSCAKLRFYLNITLWYYSNYLLNKLSVSHPKLVQIYTNSSNHSTRRKQRITDFKTAL